MIRESTIGVGLIGCGTIGYWQHLRNLKRLGSVRIAGLADPDPGALRRAARLTNAARFTEIGELLTVEEIEAVVIASPAGLHATHIEAACRAGKHIYVEKPLAHDGPSLSSARACTQNGALVVAVGHNYRFHPACQQLRRELQSGTIGAVQAVCSLFTESVEGDTWPQWRSERERGGGVMLDLATHHVDLYRWLLQDELTDLHARMRTRRFDQDSAWIQASTRGGIDLGGYFACGGSRSHALTVHGTQGMLQLDLHAGRLEWTRNRRRAYGIRRRVLAGGAAGLIWRGRKWVQPSFDPSHALALSAFVDAIRNPANRSDDLASFEDGALAVKAVLDAERTAQAEVRAPAAGFDPA